MAHLSPAESCRHSTDRRETQKARSPPAHHLGRHHPGAVNEQTVVGAGTEAAVLVVPHLARLLIALHAQRAEVASHLEALVEATLFARSYLPCLRA